MVRIFRAAGIIARYEQSNSVYVKVSYLNDCQAALNFRRCSYFMFGGGFDLFIQTVHLFIQTFPCDLKLTSKNSVKIPIIVVFPIHP